MVRSSKDGGFKEPWFFYEYPPVESSWLIQKKYPKYKLLDKVEAFGYENEDYCPLPYALIGRLGLNCFSKTPKVVFNIESIIKKP